MYGICKRWFKSKIMGHFRIVTRPYRKINKASLFMTCVLYALIRCWQKKIFVHTYLFIHSVVSLPDFHMQTHCSGQSALEWVFWIIQDDIKSSMKIKGWSFSPLIFMMFWRRELRMMIKRIFQGLFLSSLVDPVLNPTPGFQKTQPGFVFWLVEFGLGLFLCFGGWGCGTKTSSFSHHVDEKIFRGKWSSRRTMVVVLAILQWKKCQWFSEKQNKWIFH